jgi:hypothetical protein
VILRSVRLGVWNLELIRLGYAEWNPVMALATFTVDGRQVIVVSAGHALFMFGLGKASSS